MLKMGKYFGWLLMYKFIGLHPMLIYNALSGLSTLPLLILDMNLQALKGRYISALGVAL
jgi:hypothetical protein